MRSLSAERADERLLFYSAEDSAPKGTLGAPLSFGIGTESIEPEGATSLAGFGGAARRLLPPAPSGMHSLFTYCLPYTDVDLPPRAKALVWKGKDTAGKASAFAIVALDLVAVPSDVSRKLLASLREQWPELALDGSKVQFVASHSHASLAGLTENPFWSVFACDRYAPALWTFFEGKVKRAFARALQAQKPVLSAARRAVELPGFNKTRFQGMDVQKRLVSLSFSANAKPAESRTGIPCVQVFAVHPTWFGQSKLTLSSDIVGHLEHELAAVNRQEPCIVLNGVVGNADIDEPGKGTVALDDWSARFSELAFSPKLAAWSPFDASVDSGLAGIEYGSRILDLPSPKPNLKACGIPPIDALVSTRILDSLPPRTKVAYARFGKTLFVFYPGEALYTSAQAMEKALLAVRPDVDVVQILSVANDYLGYVVDSDNFDTRALESCSTLYGRGSAEVLKSAVVDLVKKETR